MAVAQQKKPRFHSFAELLGDLGVSADRIRLDPAPGQATERDVTRILDHEDRICELVDRTLVEKIMGVEESFLALWLGHQLAAFIDDHPFGFLLGPDGALRLWPGLVRAPDISYVSWRKVPTRKIPTKPIPDLAPDLAVEVLSKGNRPKEMQRKLREYFRARTQLVWFVDPRKRTVAVYTNPEYCTMLTEGQVLDGGEVLPGFRLPLAKLFAQLEAPLGRKHSSRSSRNNSR